jgi:hypothetical protein
MRFAEFYHPSTGWNGHDFSGPVKLIPACGSDSVLSFDGRWGAARVLAEARRVCTVRGWNGFTLNAGDYRSSRETRPLEVIKPLGEAA